jgi:hypothetical protein
MAPWSLAAQDNPFGPDDRPASVRQAIAQGFPAIPESATMATRLVLESIRNTNPTTPQDLATALQATMDIEAYDHAKYLLSRLIDQRLDSAALFKLRQNTGSDLFLRINNLDAVQPEGQLFARAVFQASRAEAISSERLDGLIKKLSDPSLQVRSQAFRELSRTGQPAAAAMLNVFADYERQEEFLSVREGLRMVGDAAIGPMLGACKAGPMQVRYEALTALSRIKTPEAYDAAVAAYYSPQTHNLIREGIALGLEETYGQIPGEAEALNLVSERAHAFAKGRRRSGDDIRLDLTNPYVVVWRWNEQTRLLESRNVAPSTASRLIAFDRAGDLYQWKPDRPEYRQFYLLSYLDAEKRLVGPEQSLKLEGISEAFPGIGPDEVDQTIAKAVNLDMIPAAAGGCDLLAHLATPEWLVSSSNAQSGLLRAIQSGDRHLQFAAFRTYVELDPQKAYFGNSYVVSFAVYLSGYGDRPSGLVGHPQIEVAQDLAVSMSPAGIDGRAVTNGRDFLREATSDANVRYLFVSENMTRSGFIEFVQQLRSDWRTKRMPIGILTSANDLAPLQRVADRDPLTIVLPITLDAQLIALQIERLRELEPVWLLSNTTAQFQSAYAVNWLKRITSDRQTYRFFEISGHYEALQGLLQNPMHTADAIEILGNIGTPQAQRQLVDYASQIVAPLEYRQQAVAAFEKAVSARGLLLTTEDIRLQYTRFDASSREPGESQRVLGSLLDFLENRAKTSGMDPQPW